MSEGTATTSEEAAEPTWAHRAEYAAFRSVETVLSWFSLATVVRVGSALGWLGWAIFPKWRALVTRNLRIATAADAPEAAEVGRMVRETFIRAGGNLLASQRAALMTPQELESHIRIEGLEPLQRIVAGGRGVVVVWAHMGNWEVLAQLAGSMGPGVRGGPVFRRLANPLMDDLTERRRTQRGAVVFDKHDGFNGPAGLLRSGGVVTVMSDQRAGGHGDLCPFFGRLSSCTPLPVLLARRTGAAIMTLSIATEGTAHWVLRLRPVPEKATTAEVMRCLERSMRDGLTDVFWFHDRWRIDRMRPLSFFTKIAPTAAAATATVPTRLVVTLPPGDAISVAFLEELLALRPDLRIDVLDDGHLPPLPEDPRIVAFPWDREAPEAVSSGVLERCDASHPAPLDLVVFTRGEVHLAREARRMGLRAVIGAGRSGKPWTRTVPMPADGDGWRALAGELVHTAKTRKA